MAAPFNNVPSKLERAIVAYLIGAGCGTTNDVFPSRSRGDINFPYTLVLPVRGTPTTKFTGTYTFTTQIFIYGSAVQATNEPNPIASIVAFQARVAATNDAMMQTSDGLTLTATANAITAAGRALATNGTAQQQANNADMVDFTCQQVVDGGYGNGDAKAAGCDWVEVLIFEIDACGSNVD